MRALKRTVFGGAARQMLLGCSVILFAGCSGRGQIGLMPPDAQTTGPVSQVIVATTRKPAPAPDFFSTQRSYGVNYASFDVAIPPDRAPGEVKFPKDTPDPSTDFLVTSHKALAGEKAFIQAVNAASRQDPAHTGLGTVFVHGYNTNFAEGLYREVQLSYDLRTPGMDVLFSWPSEAKLTAYLTDRESALFSRDAMADTIAAMSKSNLKGFNVVGHSMGTFLVMEALRTMALSHQTAALSKVNAVLLISADIEIDVFLKQAPPVLAAGIPIYLIVSSDDKALAFSARLRGQKDRLGSIRSVDELGGLDVTVVDLSAVESEDMAGHLKVGTSPELIQMIQALRAQGLSILNNGEQPGLIGASVGLIRIGTDELIGPLASQ
ncbi:Esterase/lipase superfamily enzyme [Gemmobacter aquatilis]|uniref:Esterase/lipase superfamily enzyme n=1 Tax=Gemmobacter aquatilis TaxID=933059 RepID=A0A1H7YF32_9RHOB|nr:alpha/beta hydrolase [Gemmobacter aquatilis]SEM44511.1 Esterase/lipase superfamily enzyme [Gemmobacter aquatilis]